jgi:alpha-tubulin suppressor-like RCC1 family protein
MNLQKIISKFSVQPAVRCALAVLLTIVFSVFPFSPTAGAAASPAPASPAPASPAPAAMPTIPSNGQVGEGGMSGCLLTPDGVVHCWGLIQLPEPNSGFIQISAGYTHTCGLKGNGDIVCWGSSKSGQKSFPAVSADNPYIQVSAGAFSTCALRQDGGIDCWDNNGILKDDTPAADPLVPFIQVSSGGDTWCGLKADHSIECWGNNYWENTDVPEPNNQFKAVGAGSSNACGLTLDGKVICWGYFGESPLPLDPDQTFDQISVGDQYACGITSTGVVRCWGDNYYHRATPPESDFPFTQVSASLMFNTCGLRSDGTVQCWGDNNDDGEGPSLQITTESSLWTSALQSYTQDLAVTTSTGILAPLSFRLIGGQKLPDGLSLNAATGQITGTPTKSGTFPFTIQVQDQNHIATEKSFTMQVAALNLISEFSSSEKQNPAPYGRPITLTVHFSGGPATGTLIFRDNGAAIAGCEAVTLVENQAACTLQRPGIGEHSFSADYSGDALNEAKSLGQLHQTISGSRLFLPLVVHTASR